MTMKTTITRSGANWPLAEAAGAPCAQAGGINEFMYSPHQCSKDPRKRNAALCHSVRRRPALEMSPGKVRHPALGDGLPQRAHQAQVEGEVVNGIEAAA